MEPGCGQGTRQGQLEPESFRRIERRFVGHRFQRVAQAGQVETLGEEGVLLHRAQLLDQRVVVLPDALRAASKDEERAEARKAAGDWPFEAYLHWFYGQMCFDPTAPDFIDRFIARVAAQGYDLP